MRPSEVVRRAAEYLDRHGVESPRASAEALLMHVLGSDRAGLYSRREALTQGEARLFGRALCRRCKSTPLQYLTGEQPFMSLVLRVGPGVFVPRPETERLVEVAAAAIEGIPSPRIVDVGAGAGAIALALKHARPDARVVATDVAEPAVATAVGNAERLGLDVDVRLGDLLDPVPSAWRGAVHLLVSNPPYLTGAEYEALPEEVRAEPYEALVGGTAVHARLAAAAAEWLREGGSLVVEIGEGQGDEVSALARNAGLVEVEVLPDLAGRPRIARARRAAPDVPSVRA